MTVNGLDHINIQSADVAATARFFADVLGLRAGASAGGGDRDMLTWMYDATGRPLVHIATADVLAATGHTVSGGRDSGSLHHVAFACSGHDAMTARLESMGLDYRRNAVPAAGLRQLFVAEPNGILLELNFRGE